MGSETSNKQYQAINQGGPFEIVSTSREIPKAGEVLVQMKAVALNPLDWKQLYRAPANPKR